MLETDTGTDKTVCPVMTVTEGDTVCEIHYFVFLF